MASRASNLNSRPDGNRASPLLQVVALALFLAVCFIAAWLGSIATLPSIPTWYAGLAKPSFTPSNQAFPIVWGILYTLMAIAAWLVWRADRPVEERWAALTPFAIQLVLNVLWSWAFFGVQSPLLGLIVIVLLLLAILWTILTFRDLSGLAALLLVPYLAWVAFAAFLNFAIYRLN
jgi:tryptophan-rich sensory protein